MSIPQPLLELGKKLGYLTYSQITNHLPDALFGDDKLEEFLLLLESEQIDVVADEEIEIREAQKRIRSGAAFVLEFGLVGTRETEAYTALQIDPGRRTSSEDIDDSV